MLGIAVGGFGVLVALAVVIGACADREARGSAWDRIATARRINHEQERRLDEREIALQARAAELDHRERLLGRREELVAERENDPRHRKPPDLRA